MAALPTNLLVTRRALVVTVSGSALALTACDLDPRSGDDAPATDQPPADPDPDLVALGDTVGATALLAGLVAATTTAHPALADRLAGFGALHAAHQAALAGAAGEPPRATVGPTPAEVAPARPRALVDVRRAESALAAELAGRAQRAESGTFARLLAVMSAAVQQELLALDLAASA